MTSAEKDVIKNILLYLLEGEEDEAIFREKLAEFQHTLQKKSPTFAQYFTDSYCSEQRLSM